MQTLDHLSEKLGLAGEVWFEDAAPGYPVARVRNAHATASVALHGAHLTDYCPHGGKPVIFTSSDAVFREGKAIRGGIPVCWPWFGAHPDGLPAHGYARTGFWTLEKTESREEGTRLVFSLPPQGHTGLAAMLEFHIGRDLRLSLQTMNGGDTETTFSEALHSYFAVADSRRTHVHGLEGARYIDTAGEESVHVQDGPVRFPGEIDRIYRSTDNTVIEDLVNRRRIRVTKTGSGSTVVWNPGQEKGASMADLADEEIHRFVCVESANVREQSITLAPGEQHTLHLRISTEP